ncbi:MAG: hypothetical protein RIB45_06385 [Marivibrio sp.]|uniref:hypothetical protein n=1 Tax=Marivibrio sp. TaxID=2039719 RepID=UPI0032F07E20
MKFIERRRLPRYPVAVGFLEIDGRTLKVDNVSEEGVGFYTDARTPLPEGGRHEGFLILQHQEDQFEIPVLFEVRRREGDYVGALVTYRDVQHRERVKDFIRVSGAEPS